MMTSSCGWAVLGTTDKYGWIKQANGGRRPRYREVVSGPSRVQFVYRYVQTLYSTYKPYTSAVKKTLSLPWKGMECFQDLGTDAGESVTGLL